MGSYPQPSAVPAYGSLQQWAQSTYYGLGQRVAANSNVYQCTTAGTSSGAGTGPSGAGGAITDGSVVWAYQVALSTAWAGTTPYALGDVVTNDGGKLYSCIKNGTSAGSGGPTGTGNVITDGTVTWTYAGSAIAQQTTPTSRTADLGAVPGAPAIAQYLNWLFGGPNGVSSWLLYLRDLVAGLLSGNNTWTGSNTFTQDTAFSQGIAVNGTSPTHWVLLQTFADAGAHITRIWQNAVGDLGISVNANFVDASNHWSSDDHSVGSSMWVQTNVSWSQLYHAATAGTWADAAWTAQSLFDATTGDFASARDIGAARNLSATTGNVTAAAGNLVATLGDAQINHVVGNTSPAPTYAAGLGQGNPAVNGDVTVVGNDIAGIISVLASAGVAAGIVVTVTFAKSFAGGAPRVQLQPTNAVTADLASQPYVTPIGGGPWTGFKFTTSATSLVSGSSYQWSYHTIG